MTSRTTLLLVALASAAFTPTAHAQLASTGPICADQHDGWAETSLAVVAADDVGWLVPYGATGTTTTVTAIHTYFGSATFPGTFTPAGPVTVAIWSDPNGDRDPLDALLLGFATAAIAPGSVTTNVLQRIVLPVPVTVNGPFFAGAVVTQLQGSFPIPLDTNSPLQCSGGGGSWIVAGYGGFDINVPANNILTRLCAPSTQVGNVVVSIDCAPNPSGVPYCFGDGTGSACPCGNVGGPGRGCANSAQAAGALLTSTGTPVVGAGDTLAFAVSGTPASVTCTLFQGTQPVNGPVFGDGLRCVGGSQQLRLGTKLASAGGVANWPGPGQPSISTTGVIPGVGGLRHYQVIYRNAAPFCTPATTNTSNGIVVTWTM